MKQVSHKRLRRLMAKESQEIVRGFIEHIYTQGFWKRMRIAVKLITKGRI